MCYVVNLWFNYTRNFGVKILDGTRLKILAKIKKALKTIFVLFPFNLKYYYYFNYYQKNME
jgi:hypothetical protein